MDVIMSLGGSMVVPDQINKSFLEDFRKLILGLVEKGSRLIIIVGGGKTAGRYIDAAKELTPSASHQDLDWVGIAATKLNAELVRTLFGDKAYESVVENPTESISTDKKIIIGCGWKPGCSTDMDAVLLAENLNVKTVINLSNIEYVYDKDPREHKDAQKIEKMSWDHLIEIVGTEWTPRMNAPFDPTATKKAKELNLKVIIAKGSDLENLRNIIENKPYIGTTIE